MIKPLRKFHLQIWSLFAVLLPVGIISAWLVVPTAKSEKLFQPEQSESLPVIVKTIKNENRVLNLRTDTNNGTYQLEWINTTALTAPSALIYQTKGDGDIKNAVIIGRIDSRGTYRFSLAKDVSVDNLHFVMYDIIHHQVIQQINF